MKQRLLLTLTVALLTQIGMVQAQEEIISVSVPDMPGQKYTLKLFDIGKNTQSNDIGDVVYLDEARAVLGESGGATVEFVIDFKETSGYYPYVIKSVASDWTGEGVLDFVNEEEYQMAKADLTAALNAENPGEALKVVLDTYEGVFLLDSNFAVGEKIKLLDTSKAYQRIAANITPETGIDELKRVYRESMLLCGVELGDNSVRVDIATNYGEDLGLDQDTLTSSKYTLLNSVGKISAADMEKGEYSTASAYAVAHRDAVCTVCVNSASSWQEIGTIIEEFGSACSLGFAPANDTIKNIALMYIAEQKPYASKAALISSISTATKKAQSGNNYDDITTNTGGGGGGGGFSSGSGSTSKPSAPVVTPPVSQDSIGQVTDEKFNDLGRVEWARDAILYLADKGIIHGKGEKAFMPEDSIKREEFVKILVETFNCEDTTLAQFSDVAEGKWYTPYINKGVACGFVSGYGENIFGVGEIITRQDACVMLAKAAGYDLEAENTIDAKFGDAGDISGYAKNAVCVLAEKGFVNGTTDGLFLPKKPISRAEASMIIYNYLTGGKN